MSIGNFFQVNASTWYACYKTNKKPHVIYFALYFHFSISAGRAVYLVYFPSSETLLVLVVNPYQNKDLSPAILERQFREACQALSSKPPPQNDILYKVSGCFHQIKAFLIFSTCMRFHLCFVICTNFRWTMSDMSRMLKRFYNEKLMNTGLHIVFLFSGKRNCVAP